MRIRITCRRLGLDHYIGVGSGSILYLCHRSKMVDFKLLKNINKCRLGKPQISYFFSGMATKSGGGGDKGLVAKKKRTFFEALFKLF